MVLFAARSRAIPAPCFSVAGKPLLAGQLVTLREGRRMAENTKIEWAKHTWNPWIGCQKVGPPCDHCYAESMMDHRYRKVHWGPGEDRKRTSDANWRLPFKWDKAAEAAGEIHTVFCLSLGDIWDKEVDPRWRYDAMNVMERTPNLLYLLLSKRIGNAIKMCDPMAGHRMLPRNCALGSTMASQPEWDRDMPKLREAGRVLGARFIFASVEPMLGPIDTCGDLPDWAIVGGESGAHARPMHPDWARQIRDQCAAAGVAFFFKQWGEWAPTGDWYAYHPISLPIRAWDGSKWSDDGNIEGEWVARIGKSRAGRLLDGVEHNAMPRELCHATPTPRSER